MQKYKRKKNPLHKGRFQIKRSYDSLFTRYLLRIFKANQNKKKSINKLKIK